jgi:hypothetical protein
MAFSRDCLVIDEQCSRNVSQPMKTLPVLPQNPDRELIARHSEDHKNDQARCSKPNKWL